MLEQDTADVLAQREQLFLPRRVTLIRIEPVHDLAVHQIEQLFLVGEVAVKRHRGRADLSRHGANGQAVDTGAVDDGERSAENRFTGSRSARSLLPHELDLEPLSPAREASNTFPKSYGAVRAYGNERPVT